MEDVVSCLIESERSQWFPKKMGMADSENLRDRSTHVSTVSGDLPSSLMQLRGKHPGENMHILTANSSDHRGHLCLPERLD